MSAKTAARRDRLAVRPVCLYLGLAGFGVNLALMVRARLGLGPWDVLHQGSAPRKGDQAGAPRGAAVGQAGGWVIGLCFAAASVLVAIGAVG